MKNLTEHFVKNQLGDAAFRASDGWLDKLKKRHKLVSRVMHGEIASSDAKGAEDYKPRLVELLSQYADRDILNVDETGLYWKQTSNKSLMDVSDTAGGSKKEKARVTLMITCSMSGEIFPVTVINTHLKPRSFAPFKGDLSKVPKSIVWRANKKAWMNGYLFAEYLKNLNSAMKDQNRSVLLFMDNFSGHEVAVHDLEVNGDLTNVKVEFFPPNTTPILQPIDMGIANTFKTRYRQQLHMRMASNVEQGQPVETSIDLFRCILWIGRVWNFFKSEVGKKIIVNCFRKAGFKRQDTEELDSSADPQMNEEELNLLNTEEQVKDSVATVEEIVKEIENGIADEEVSDAAIEEENTEEVKDQDATDYADLQIPKHKDALNAIKTLELYCEWHGDSEFLEYLQKMQEDVYVRLQTSRTQTTLDSFFARRQ